MNKIKEKKYTWQEVSKQIDSVWRGNAWGDSWGVRVIYKKMFKAYLKKKLNNQ